MPQGLTPTLALTLTLALSLAFLTPTLTLTRFVKVYSITRDEKNLWNALKYSTAFPLVYCSYMRQHAPSPYHDGLFVLAALVQSNYCYVWDLHMDWGLFRRRQRSPCGIALRQILLVTQRQPVYAVLCVFNLLLRFAWALTIFGGIQGRGAGMFFFEAVEILRRCGAVTLEA